MDEYTICNMHLTAESTVVSGSIFGCVSCHVQELSAEVHGGGGMSILRCIYIRRAGILMDMDIKRGERGKGEGERGVQKYLVRGCVSVWECGIDQIDIRRDGWRDRWQQSRGWGWCGVIDGNGILSS